MFYLYLKLYPGRYEVRNNFLVEAKASALLSANFSDNGTDQVHCGWCLAS